MNNYEAPSIVELGSVEGLTAASGRESAIDSNLPSVIGFLGYFGNGGDPGSYGS